jgi:hypothetical protein
LTGGSIFAELTMDNLVAMYEGLGDDMFKINFEALSKDGVLNLNSIISYLAGTG